MKSAQRGAAARPRTAKGCRLPGPGSDPWWLRGPGLRRGASCGPCRHVRRAGTTHHTHHHFPSTIHHPRRSLTASSLRREWWSTEAPLPASRPGSRLSRQARPLFVFHPSAVMRAAGLPMWHAVPRELPGSRPAIGGSHRDSPLCDHRPCVSRCVHCPPIPIHTQDGCTVRSALLEEAMGPTLRVRGHDRRACTSLGWGGKVHRSAGANDCGLRQRLSVSRAGFRKL